VALRLRPGQLVRNIPGRIIAIPVLSLIPFAVAAPAVAAGFVATLDWHRIGVLLLLFAPLGLRAIPASITVPIDTETTASPTGVVRADRRARLVTALLRASIGLLLVWLYCAPTLVLAYGGFLLGRAVIGFAFADARPVAVLLRRVPARTGAFLADAHRRGVLRQVGAVYQFRHIRLQDRLAEGWIPRWTRLRRRVAVWCRTVLWPWLVAHVPPVARADRWWRSVTRRALDEQRAAHDAMARAVAARRERDAE